MAMQSIATDSTTAQAARELINTFGEVAAFEAAARADASRDKGNYIHFCHWRQVERFILVLGTERILGSVH